MKPTLTAASYKFTLTTIVIAVSLFAGLGLVLWGLSPFASLLSHDSMSVRGLPDVLFVFGWLLMCVAMMLPTALPLLAAVERLTSQRTDTRQLVSIAAVGFLSVWLGSGILVRVGDIWFHGLVNQNVWLAAHPKQVGAILLSIAGVYLLSPIAQKCVSACQSPMGFIARAWTGQPNVRRQVARIGWEYGLSCFGCCWPLMAVMCALGMSNLVWILIFTLVMIFQKHDRYGKLVTTMSGITILTVAVVLLVGTLPMPEVVHSHTHSHSH
jgi:predicted metal-binding membrane protein